MKTFSQKLPALKPNEDARRAHPAATKLASATVKLLEAGAALGKTVANVPGHTGPESHFAEGEEAYNRAAEAYADAVVAVIAASHLPWDFTGTPPAPDIAEAASYLAINILNVGELKYAKEAIAATLAQERSRCAQVVGFHFPRTEDERAEKAILDIERGRIVR